MLKELTAEACTHLLAKLVPLGDKYYEWSERLIQDGMVAHFALRSVFENLALNKGELTLHKELEIEQAKQIFANPFRGMAGLSGTEKFRPAYVSEKISLLQHLNDPEGTLNEQIRFGRQPGWRRQIDPLRRRYEQIPIEHWKERNEKFRDEYNSLRQREIDVLLHGTHKRAKLQDKDAFILAFDMLDHHISKLGFVRNNKLSPKKAVLFTKHISDEWLLNITMLNDFWGCTHAGHVLVKNDERMVSAPKSFQMYLDLRLKRQKGLYVKRLCWLPIEYMELSPLRTSQNSFYHDMDECEVAILGYIRLYELMADKIEAGLIEGLREL